MNVVLIEDEYPAAKHVKTLLEKIDASIKVIDVLDSVSASCKWFEKNDPPDLILSDIQLSDGLSFEIYERFGLVSPIIFTTAYDEYAIRAFKLNSIDYLVKPIQLAELSQALDKYKSTRFIAPANEMQQQLAALLASVRDEEPKFKERFLVKGAEALVPVFQTEIAFFSSAHEITHLIRKDGKRFAIDYSLSELEECLNPRSFFRANRQYIVHAHAINRVFPYLNGRLLLSLTPKPKKDVIISKSKAPAFKKWFDHG